MRITNERLTVLATEKRLGYSTLEVMDLAHDLLDARVRLAQMDSAIDSADERLQEALTELAALKEAE